MIRYIVIECSNDNVGADSSWYADIDERVVNTYVEAKELVRENAIKTLTALNSNSKDNIIYFSTANTLDIELEDFDDELEIWREEDLGSGIYTPISMITRYSIKQIKI